MLDQAMKLQAFQPVLAYNLALCYHQLGDRDQALEYLRKAKAGTPEPKQKQKLLQLQTFFTTGENGLSVNESDRDRIAPGQPPRRQRRAGSIAGRRRRSRGVVRGSRRCIS